MSRIKNSIEKGARLVAELYTLQTARQLLGTNAKIFTLSGPINHWHILLTMSLNYAYINLRIREVPVPLPSWENSKFCKGDYTVSLHLPSSKLIWKKVPNASRYYSPHWSRIPSPFWDSAPQWLWCQLLAGNMCAYDWYPECTGRTDKQGGVGSEI